MSTLDITDNTKELKEENVVEEEAARVAAEEEAARVAAQAEEEEAARVAAQAEQEEAATEGVHVTVEEKEKQENTLNQVSKSRRLRIEIKRHITNENYGLLREYFPVYFKELYPYVLKGNLTEKEIWKRLKLKKPRESMKMTYNRIRRNV